MKNSCDYAHMTNCEVRLLPTGSDGNMIICENHYRKELRYRLDRTFNDGTSWKFPAWHTLKIYDPT